MLDSEAIKDLLPHGNGMSLLDEVEVWDDVSIKCLSKSHLREDNPIVSPELNHSSLLIEYAAQAAAVHAGLLNSNLGENRPAFVGAVKNVELKQEMIPRCDAPLEIEVKAELLNGSGAIYDFSVKSESSQIIIGKLVLVQP
ncbi:MAG: hypothetical protein K6L76_05670 [Agarilytica sp.]